MVYSDYEITIAYKRKINYDKRVVLNHAQDVVKCVKSLMEDSIDYKETFYALYLDQANKLIAVHKIGIGTAKNVAVDIKFILQGAILSNATQLIIAHNHPSGAAYPSSPDKQITSRIKAACELMDVDLLDSLIVSQDKYFSFREESYL